VSIKVKENPYFQREGDNIRVNLPISFLDAILGGTAEVIVFEIVPGPDGPKRITKVKEITIPKLTQPGACLTLQGLGCYTDINQITRGELNIYFQVKLPKKITSAAEEMLRNLQKETT
jgi:molecular chaperone DnaJ